MTGPKSLQVAIMTGCGPLISWRWMRTAYWLAAFVLLFKAILPPGTMLASDSGRALQIVICTGSGPVETTLDIPDNKTKPAAPDAPCAFAGLASPAPLPEAVALATPLLLAAPLALSPFAIAIGQGLAAPPPPATGPPILL